MNRNKDRVYVALYARGGAAKASDSADSYHWAILVGPKHETLGSNGMRFHARDSMAADGLVNWVFEERKISMLQSGMLLVRIIVGKVEDQKRLFDSVRGTPIRAGLLGWTCKAWVKEALERIASDKNAMGTSVLDWAVVHDEAIKYCGEKKGQHRFDGQGSGYDPHRAPTFSLLESKETIP